MNKNLAENAERERAGVMRRGLDLCTISESDGGFAEYFQGRAALEEGDIRSWSPKNQTKAAITGILMNNTREWLGSLDETTRALTVGGFADHIFAMIRAGMTNNPIMDMVSVQPMTQSIGRIFFLNYVIGQTKGSYVKGQRVFDAQEGYQGGSTYTGTTIQGEGFVDATASATYSGVLSYQPAIRGSVVLYFGDSQEKLVVRDDGNGGFVKVSGTLALSSGSINYANGAFSVTAGTAFAAGDAVSADYEYEAEGATNLPQVDIQISAIGITAIERAMRMRYSTNSAFDFKQQFGESPDALLVSGVSDLVKAEVGREIIHDLWVAAGTPVESFSIGAVSGLSKIEHLADLVNSLNNVDAAIYSATQQVHGNWIVCDIPAAAIIKSIPAPIWQAAPIDNATSGIQYLGKLAGQFDVYVDKFLANEPGASALGNILMGHRGEDWRTSGYVYAPYQPITTTMAVTLDDLLTRKALNTRYAKKVVNPRFYKRLSLVA